ncbi:alpha/beta hydrolase [Burkholderia lata]|uniref:alpha/beta fold hydrolase n=1 Tax=Burkholderia lata (strain ATCC 17760 / DSM 23089 / LMG 22485 / NCIMB 9086 / R18194 / 383) TaxID=482957 RepID=UPI001452E65B|nr:alpha/beta hydrolase [Burkholderia lata]VWD12565.1 alpha/beta hydrolase [Burkholderia lata]
MVRFTSSERRSCFSVFGTGRPLVLLHGITNSGRAWVAQFGPFVAAGYQVTVPDHAGHGAPAPLRAPVSVADLADDVRTLLDELAIGSADVVGLSLGGLVAMQLSLEAPERGGRLVIVNSFPAFRGDGVRAMVQSWIEMFREPDGPTKRFEKTWPINASDAFWRSIEGIRMYQLPHGLATMAIGESLAHVAEGIVGFDAEARLSHIDGDTVFVAAALDTMSTPALSRRIADTGDVSNCRTPRICPTWTRRKRSTRPFSRSCPTRFDCGRNS